MNKQNINNQDENDINQDSRVKKRKRKTNLAVVALMLDIISLVLLGFLKLFIIVCEGGYINGYIYVYGSMFLIFLIIALLIAGIIVGIISLCLGKKRIAIKGIFCAIAAIIIPILCLWVFVIL